ncbi:similar to Saccharomyces cerevisiae YOR089C VPS21 Rab family GTPase required for endocytic transport and for sorting of vacuolar hydrolases [Maudiozyma saulgeensis]|uniref:Similar to Saccharomyces cerevisiae YOR089C VPS21 Rab family GTPase required for endocytic transport and for sorting of vacuolar hydrolases n=1 Tax=Maudiozyma saulgeensis TaxID=1789683 RepID=A0A1X7R197_9SACH|nr:similar to Saccharomyces cerevisiae YOR089C VPS21 Rab family GTPase required for endocytic transport and for sorting of vacuolar hydrolases [Kazachstania saulgeensis]
MTNPVESRNGKRHCNLKVVLLGDSSVGKSSLVMRYVIGKFQTSNATIGAAFMTKTIQLNGDKEVTLEIWDTAGQERYRSLTPMYYRGTDVAIIVYDVTSPISLSHAETWIDELKSYVDTERNSSALKIILAANKADLVDGYQQPEELKKSRSENFFVVSAKSGDGIEELFDGVVGDLPDEMFIKHSQTVENETIQIDKKFYNIDTSSCNC